MEDSDPKGSQAREDQELKVTDRRQFTAEGELRNDAEIEPAEPVAEITQAAEPNAKGAEPDPSGSARPGEFEHRPVDEPQGVDFTMLINGMAEPALLFLGEIHHPSSDQPTVDLDRARFQIDMLDLLRVKCRGNLTPEEEGLLDRILYRLRMLYVARAKQPDS